MNTIHKFSLTVRAGFHEIEVPQNAKFLKCADQGGVLVLWYEVDTNEPFQVLQFAAYKTGDEFLESIRYRCVYLDTVMFFDGRFVLHVYSVELK